MNDGSCQVHAQKNVDDVTSLFEGTWRKPIAIDVASRPRIT